MKILFVVNELNFFMRNHLNLAKSIRMHHEVELIADVSKSNEESIYKLKQAGITLHILNRNTKINKGMSYLPFIFYLLKIIRRNKPDYVLYITLELSFFGSLISYFLSIKKSIFIITGLGPFFFKKEFKYRVFNKLQKYSFILLSFLKKNFLFIFLNSADKDLISSKYKISPDHCRLIHGEGIDTSEFRYLSRKNTGAKFLLASRLVRSKGIESFVTAAMKIKQKYPEAKFSIAGIFDPENPESISPEIFSKIQENDCLNFMGEISHEKMESCFHENNIFVLPSEREGLPKAAVEAASTGMALILSDVPGCQDCVVNDKSGKLVKYMDDDQLFQAMECFLCDEKLINTMGDRSAQLVKEKFSLDIITKKYLQIIS
jgi:glycosyltransferase involved in cell wall biosynthesis